VYSNETYLTKLDDEQILLNLAGKLSKVILFDKLRKGIIVGLENAGNYMLPLPNSTECPNYVSSAKNKVKNTSNSMNDTTSESNKPITAIQIATSIANALHEMFVYK